MRDHEKQLTNFLNFKKIVKITTLPNKVRHKLLRVTSLAVLLQVIILFTPAAYCQEAFTDEDQSGRLNIHTASDTTIVLHIYFEQSVSELRQEYLDNSGVMEKFITTMSDILKSPKFALSAIHIESSCSPEGTMGFNIELGQARAEVLYQALTDNFNIPDSLIHAEPGGPNWTGLEQLILAHKEEIEHSEDALQVIYDYPMRHKFDERAHNLRLSIFDSIYHRTLWDQLHEQFFPQLRQTTVEVRFDGKIINTTSYLKTDTIKTVLDPASYELLPTVPPFKDAPEQMPVASVKSGQPILAVKTNLLYYAAFVPQYGFCPAPNIALEYLPRHGRWTVGASLDMPWYRNYSNHKFFQIRNWEIEARRYFGKSWQYAGWYAQAYVNTGVFGIGFSKTQGWEGESGGFGLGGGYVMPISRDQRLKLEFNLQIGFLRSQYDPYVYGHPTDGKEDGLYYYDWTYNPDLFKERQYRHNWFGPTRIGITLRYDLFNYPPEKSKTDKDNFFKDLFKKDDKNNFFKDLFKKNDNKETAKTKKADK